MSALVKTETVAQRAARIIERGPDAVTSGLSSEVLLYLARKYVSREWAARQRAHARKGEADTRAALPRRTSDEVKADLYRAARREAWALILGQGFTAGDDFVTWGAATRNDHMRRVGAQAELADGIAADIALHESALDDLARFNVSRLADL